MLFKPEDSEHKHTRPNENITVIILVCFQQPPSRRICYTGIVAFLSVQPVARVRLITFSKVHPKSDCNIQRTPTRLVNSLAKSVFNWSVFFFFQCYCSEGGCARIIIPAFKYLNFLGIYVYIYIIYLQVLSSLLHTCARKTALNAQTRG